MERGSGLLVHISALPSKHGIGTFGKEARRFVRFLNKSNQKYWQLLPLNPTSYGDSPYQSFSAFALNPYFIDLDYLLKDGYLLKDEVKKIRGGSNLSYVDYGKVYNERFDILHKAYKRAFDVEKEKIDKFYKKNIKWLDDYALFMTIKSMFNGVSFQEWPDQYRLHRRNILNEVRSNHQDKYYFYVWMQYEAYKQYIKLKKYANKKGIKIIGDMPIYVSLDSADCWGNSKLFKLTRSRRPTLVAGVPPDCFSSTGQLWGNPIYDYDYMKKTSYRWWKLRFKAMSKLYDYLRIDHFRGFDEYWAISSKENTAINGEWLKGPGFDLFNACEKELKKVNIIAEDLGIITDSVRDLKEKCNFPGLKIFQFAFGDYEKHLNGDYGDEYHLYKDRLEKNYENEKESKLAKLCNPYLPHNYEANSVAYIGTHDNDVLENYLLENPQEHEFMLDYLNIDNVNDIHDTMIGSLMRSNADVVIFLPQDILKLGKYSRINLPGSPVGNWQYRFRREHFNDKFINHLKHMTQEANR